MPLNHASKSGSQVSIEVSPDALPLSCPQAHDILWNQHPRVFLALGSTAEAHCPYCGQHYILASVKGA